MATINTCKPDIVRIAYRPDQDQDDKHACTWMNCDFDASKGILQITGDCGNYAYRWPETDMHFWTLCATMDSDYLAEKLFRSADRVFDKERTIANLREYFEASEEDPDWTSTVLGDLKDLLDEYDLEDCVPLAEYLVDQWNEDDELGIDSPWEFVESSYTPQQNKIVQIFTEYIQPKIKIMLSNASMTPHQSINKKPTPSQDAVNHPAHYTDGTIEVIDYIRDKLSRQEFVGFCTGNVLKYLSRWKHKGGIEDLKKAQVYLRWAIERENQSQTGKTDEIKKAHDRLNEVIDKMESAVHRIDMGRA